MIAKQLPDMFQSRYVQNIIFNIAIAAQNWRGFSGAIKYFPICAIHQPVRQSPVFDIPTPELKIEVI